jgi:hypothetical protein
MQIISTSFIKSTACNKKHEKKKRWEECELGLGRCYGNGPGKEGGGLDWDGDGIGASGHILELE